MQKVEQLRGWAGSPIACLSFYQRNGTGFVKSRYMRNNSQWFLPHCKEEGIPSPEGIPFKDPVDFSLHVRLC